MANLNRIKVVLVEQQKTGKWLAEQMGKSACTVSKWCSNSSQPDLATLDKIATLLDVDRRDLIAPSKQERNSILEKKLVFLIYNIIQVNGQENKKYRGTD